MSDDNYKAPDWSVVDWSKTDKALAFDLNVPTIVVSFYRKAVGRPKSVSSRVNWKSIDWNKNNQQISFETKTPLQKVSVARSIVGHPPIKNSVLCAANGQNNRVITDEMIAAINWEFEKDFHIARQWRVSRERVRQIRQERGLPACLINLIENRSIEVQKWLLENKDRISGMLSSIVARECPTDLPITRKLDIMRSTSIPFVWVPLKRSAADVLPINWGLPNLVINAVWNKCCNWAASNRYKYQKEKSTVKYISQGRWGRISVCDLVKTDGEIRSLVVAEIDKAVKLGVTPKWDVIETFGIQRPDETQNQTAA